MNENIDVKLSIEELKSVFNRQINRISTMRDIAKTILGSVSLIVPIVGSLTALRGTSPENLRLYNSLAVLAGFFFILLIIFSVRLLMLVDTWAPIKSDQKVYEDNLFGKDERDVLLQLFSSYLNVVQLNSTALKKKAREASLLGLLMIFIVICMIGLILVK